jgi:hypothetical protein
VLRRERFLYECIAARQRASASRLKPLLSQRTTLPLSYQSPRTMRVAG